jgi:hypothetical protein
MNRSRVVFIILALFTLLLVLHMNRAQQQQSHDDSVNDRHESVAAPPPPAPGGDSDGEKFSVRFSATSASDEAIQFACAVAEFPNATDFVDLVALLPVVDAYVHHIDVFACDETVASMAISSDCCSRACFFDLAQPCHSIVSVWDKGAEPFRLPSPYGVRVGRRTTTRSHVVVQVHSLNVPRHVPRALGVDFLVASSQLRDEQAHWFYFDDVTLALPPASSNASAQTSLWDGDLCEQLTGADDTFLLAVHAHMHTRGRRVFLTRRTKSGVVEDLFADLAYAGYGKSQNVHWLATPISVAHDDVISLRCEYDTRGDRAPVTFGVSDADEMCAVAMLFNGPISDGSTNFVRHTT